MNLVFVIGPNTTCTKQTNNVFKHVCIQHTVGNKLTHNIITNRIGIASKSAHYTVKSEYVHTILLIVNEFKKADIKLFLNGFYGFL